MSKRDVQTLAKQIARGTEKLIAKRGHREFDDERPALLAQEQAKSLTESSVGGGGKFKSMRADAMHSSLAAPRTRNAS